MKDVLKNLFDPRTPTTSYGTVYARISSTRYELRDRGKVRYVSSTDYYPPGTEVVVQDGIIVRAGRRAGVPKVYEV